MRETSRKIFASDVMDKVGEIYGLDKEGEIKGSYKPAGFPRVC